MKGNVSKLPCEDGYVCDYIKDKKYHHKSFTNQKY